MECEIVRKMGRESGQGEGSLSWRGAAKDPNNIRNCRRDGRTQPLSTHAQKRKQANPLHDTFIY